MAATQQVCNTGGGGKGSMGKTGKWHVPLQWRNMLIIRRCSSLNLHLRLLHVNNDNHEL